MLIDYINKVEERNPDPNLTQVSVNLSIQISEILLLVVEGHDIRNGKVELGEIMWNLASALIVTNSEFEEDALVPMVAQNMDDVVSYCIFMSIESGKLAAEIGQHGEDAEFRTFSAILGVMLNVMTVVNYIGSSLDEICQLSLDRRRGTPTVMSEIEQMRKILEN